MLADNVVETQRVGAHQHRWTGEALFALEAVNAELDATRRDLGEQVRELREVVRRLVGVVQGVVFRVRVVLLLRARGGRFIRDSGGGGYFNGRLF